MSAALIQFLVSGITVGAIYGLIAVGYSLVYNATDGVNFAQGEFVMLGGMLTIALYAATLPLAGAVAGAVVGVAIVGGAFQRVTIHPLRNVTPMTLIMITIGGSLVLKSAAMFGWGKDAKTLPAFSSERPLAIAGAAVLPQALWIIGVTAAVVVGLRYYFQRTMAGKAMRAAACDPTVARLMGIRVKRMTMLSFALSGAVGAVAGALIAPITFMAFDRGTLLGVKGFSAAILGGLGNPFGAFAGGLVLGLLESLGAGLVSSKYKDALAFLVLILMLFARPAGLFGQPLDRKV